MALNDAFSSRHRRFIEWKATPKAHRDPRTQEQLAKKLGVGKRTLVRWSKLPEVKDAIRGRIRELLGDALPELYAVLQSKALTGSFPHLKMAFEMLGEYVEKSEVDATHTVILPTVLLDAYNRGYENADRDDE